MTSRLPGFYKAQLADRRTQLLEAAGLPEGAFAAIDPAALPLDVADGMIENVVGEYALPFAVADEGDDGSRDRGQEGERKQRAAKARHRSGS